MKKLGLAGIVAVGVAMFGMSTTAHAESYLHATTDPEIWELYIDGLEPDQIFDLEIECGGEFVEYIQGEHDADSEGVYQIWFGTDPESTGEGCVVNVLDMEEATIQTIAFPQVPKAGANTTSMLLVVAALIGAGGLLVGTTRVRRGQPA